MNECDLVWLAVGVTFGDLAKSEFELVVTHGITLWVALWVALAGCIAWYRSAAGARLISKIYDREIWPHHIVQLAEKSPHVRTGIHVTGDCARAFGRDVIDESAKACFAEFAIVASV